MAPFLALGANALAITILALTIEYGTRFSTTVYMDGKIGPDTDTRCLFINDCKAVDVDHCFWSSQVMIIVLALGGILIVDFTLWGFSLQSAYLDTCTASPRTGFLSLLLGSGSGSPQARADDEEDDDDTDDYGMPKVKRQRRHEASTLMVAILCALGCASTLALFAPHKTTLNIRNPVASYPVQDYMKSLTKFVQTDTVASGLSDLLVESAAVTRDALVRYVDAEEGIPYTRELQVDQTEAQRTHRIGDTTYQGLRTQGVGVNMASFNEYLLSSRDKLVNLGNSTFSKYKFPSALSRNSMLAQTWMVAPDYQLASLNAKVHGTDMDVTCTDVTSEFTVQWGQTTVTDSTKGPEWKPLPRAHQLNKVDIWNYKLGIYTQYVHQRYEPIQVMPLLKEPRMSNDVDQYISITDSSNPYARLATVLKCTFSGQDFLTDIEIKHGVMKIKDSRSDPLPLATEPIAMTRWVATGVLQNGRSSVASAIYRMNMAQARSASGKTTNAELVGRMVEDILTDLAQGYWSLVRQQVETSIGLWAFDSYPKGLSRYNNGRLLGTYTQLGGSSWGLILPYVLLVLPAVALVRLLLSIVFDTRSGKESAGRWQPLTQFDEENIVVNFIDTPPPMPPPKDDEEEPPPPYAARMENVQTTGERP